MNAPVKPNLILQTIAADNLARIRADQAAGDSRHPVDVAMSQWWAKLKRHQRRAFYTFSGVNGSSVDAQWFDIPLKYRAALALMLPELAELTNQIRVTVSGVREQAKAVLMNETRRPSASARAA